MLGYISVTQTRMIHGIIIKLFNKALDGNKI